jgi:hypothetical protein
VSLAKITEGLRERDAAPTHARTHRPTHARTPAPTHAGSLTRVTDPQRQSQLRSSSEVVEFATLSARGPMARQMARRVLMTKVVPLSDPAVGPARWHVPAPLLDGGSRFAVRLLPANEA